MVSDEHLDELERRLRENLAYHQKRYHRAVDPILKQLVEIQRLRPCRVLIPSTQLTMTDSERLDWYEAQHTLHKSLEVLYVVDGYELSLMAQDGDVVVATFKGETLRKAIDQAMSASQPTGER